MSTKQTEALYKAGRTYVKKLIRMRKALMNKGVNTAIHAPAVVDELDGLLNFWPYNTNEKMAAFINNKSEKIMYLIPGPNCRAHQSLMSEFENLYTQSRETIGYGTICR